MYTNELRIKRSAAIEQLILSLGALPLDRSWNLSALAEKMVNELQQTAHRISIKENSDYFKIEEQNQKIRNQVTKR